MSQKITVFLPTYNERANLPVMVERLMALGLDLSILIVDDSSPDGTGDAAEQLAAAHAGRIRVIHRDGPRGRGLAGIVGLSEAAKTDCDFVVEMDADLSHEPEEIPRLLQAAEQADVVIGSRYIAGGKAENFGWLRTLNSATARWLSILILGLRFSDPTSGYRIYRREVLAQLPWEGMISPGPSIVEETLYYVKRLNARIVEVPIRYVERKHGSSKITIGIILRWIMTLLKIRWAAKT
ncbi:MAG: polyprenol monophosphomannose synthase [Candidatus Omnitrophota bacterium]|jgi:dolichol-phosphate mannosyltransferase|nr:MAG: polyprenol monophosphomannose synthase [Candidatus Omnitrophota bacterium]